MVTKKKSLKKPLNQPRKLKQPKSKEATGTQKPKTVTPLAPRALQALRDAGRPLLFEDLSERLGLGTAPQRKRLQKELDDLVLSAELLRNRRQEYCLRERLSLMVGTIAGHRDGHGFLHPDDDSAPIFLPPRQMREVMHGDRATVRVSETDARGRPQGTIVEVLERGTQTVVGRLYEEAGIFFVVPDNPRITHRVLIPKQHLADAESGQVVLAKLIEQPSRTAQALGAITRILGEHAAPGMETDIAIHSHGLPFEFAHAVLAEAAAHGKHVHEAAVRGREDLRAAPLVTIDGEDARDFDDAVWCQRVRGGWQLVVAIADVAQYVLPDSALDGEAQNRATSVYFPNRVLPMLPEALSNGLCSLNPHVDRLCMVCEMRVNAEGKVTRARFFEGVMRSVARLTYTEVAGFLANPQAYHDTKLTALAEPLTALYEVFRALHAARLERGALDFDAPELKVSFDERGRVAALVERSRNDAHRLIEECMIAANVQAARFLKKHRMPTLYRVHGQPDPERLLKLKEFLAGFGISLPSTDEEKLEPRVLGEVLKQAARSEEAQLIETVVVRSLQQAVYQPENIGHFGLALPEYAHFTSPIRRYPDLLVHRGIRHILRGGKAQDFLYSRAAVEQLGRNCSFKERRADEATRDAMSWLKCEYMTNRLGEEFDAIVSGVMDFGLFVQLKELQVDGLVHVSALGADYFSRDRSGYRMIGARSGKTFRLGDRLRVRLINVSIDERKIDFELTDVRSRGTMPRHQGHFRGRRRGRR